MDEIQKCECPPESPSYVDEEGMIICNSCGGWIEGQYQMLKLFEFMIETKITLLI